MKIVLAIDSFKGSLRSAEANHAAAQGIEAVCPDAEIVKVAVSDGGEGFVEAFHAACGGKLVELPVRDPLLRPVAARYLLNDKLAVIEIAQASGLTLLTPEERDPLRATSYGTGELVADAVRKGAHHIIVGLGGSATSDAGMGMLRALVDAFAGGGAWDDIGVLRDVTFTVASDVQNPLCGKQGAAHVFAPQKARPADAAATAAMVCRLDERARRFAEVSARHFGYDRSSMEGAGAAGGLGYAFLQYMNATCRPGISLLLETIGFADIIKDADYIVTGEGAADRQTLMGKLPVGILHAAAGVPVFLIAGKISHRDALLDAGFARVECIHPAGLSLEEGMRKEVAQRHVMNTASRLFRSL